LYAVDEDYEMMQNMQFWRRGRWEGIMPEM
jgi:hypothetical protein